MVSVRRMLRGIGMAAAAAAWVLRPGTAAGPSCAWADAQTQPSHDDLASPADVLDDAHSLPEQKEEAARLLLQRGPGGSDILAKVLDKGSRINQVAVARALALQPHPDPAYIDSLGQLLWRRDRELTDAAAHALANYQENPQALQDLVSFVTNDLQDELSRVAAIRAMGNVVAKDAAAALMKIIQSDNPQSVLTAATDALVDLTGRQDLGGDISRWVEYWKDAADQDARTLRIQWLESRQARMARMSYQHALLVESLRDVLSKALASAGEKQRAALLCNWMSHSQAAYRLSAVRIISDNYKLGIPPEASVKEKLRTMIGDSSTQVRLEAVMALEPTNDAEALGFLLKQLELEKDPDVKTEIARALGPLQNARAVDPLLQLLSSEPSLRVREAAALSLAKLGDTNTIQQAAATDKVADALLATLDWANTQPGTTNLRENVMDALSKLRLPKLLSIFQSYASLQNRAQNTPKIRRAAYRGLGNIQGLDAQTEENVASDLAADLERESDSGVQLAIIETIGKIGSINQAQALYKWMKGPIDDAVRPEVWKVLKTFFENAPDAQSLDAWVSTIAHDNDPARLRDVLLAQISKLNKNDPAKLAAAQQSLGQADLEVDKPNEAVVNFQAALDYFKSQAKDNAPDPTIPTLINQLMEARLRAHQYPEAVKFAAQTIADHKDTADAFGKAIVREVERLTKGSDNKSALELINAAIPLPLGDPYTSQLRAKRAELNPPH